MFPNKGLSTVFCLQLNVYKMSMSNGGMHFAHLFYNIYILEKPQGSHSPICDAYADRLIKLIIAHPVNK